MGLFRICIPRDLDKNTTLSELYVFSFPTVKMRIIFHRIMVMATNLDSILKSRDITLPTRVCLVKAMVFTVVMHGCES